MDAAKIELHRKAAEEYLRSLMDAKKKFAERSSQSLDEILRPEQMARLKQIAFYVEIAYRGLDGALADGRLGREIGVVGTQIPILRQKIPPILDEAERKIRSIRIAAQDRILNELSTEQRNAANNLLGPYFEFIDSGLILMKERLLDQNDSLLAQP